MDAVENTYLVSPGFKVTVGLIMKKKSPNGILTLRWSYAHNYEAAL